MSGFMKFFRAGVIDDLPHILGVQSEHADPVYRYYAQPPGSGRKFTPVAVRASVAQAAMIGNPVSMPRVIRLAETYSRLAGKEAVSFVRVSEQQIMDWQLTANRNGHIACTHGGETLAGLVTALAQGLLDPGDTAVLDSTAHALKFAGFQQMYFDNRFPPEFEVAPRSDLSNAPLAMQPDGDIPVPQAGKPLSGDDMERFVGQVADEIARLLGLAPEDVLDSGGV
jgi:threonine synthase